MLQYGNYDAWLMVQLYLQFYLANLFLDKYHVYFADLKGIDHRYTECHKDMEILMQH